MEAGNEIVEVFQVQWLGEKGVGAHEVGALDVVGILRGSEDDDNEILELRMALDPSQNFKTVSPGHFEVQEDDRGTCVGAVAEKFDRVLSAATRVDRIVDAKLSKSTKKQIDVVLGIINEQDCFEASHPIECDYDAFRDLLQRKMYLHQFMTPMGCAPHLKRASIISGPGGFRREPHPRSRTQRWYEGAAPERVDQRA